MKPSPVAQLFWGSIIRHLLTAVAGMLVLHGYVSVSDSNKYVEELVGLTLQAAVMFWSNRITYWEQIKKLIARTMPKGTTDTAVNAKVAELTEAKALPSVFTPADVVPSLAKV